MLFAYLKRILGPGRLRLRGPFGASDEFLLPAITQNLRKLAKIFPAPQHPQNPIKTPSFSAESSSRDTDPGEGGKVGKV